MTPYLQDADFTLWNGDVRDVLAQLEPGTVDCVITSPPYWGLRDYGTGLWDSGDPDCDHQADVRFRDSSGIRDTSRPSVEREQQGKGTPFRDVCGRCGARRVDNQIGLEPTPDQYVQTIVQVFREVRRVLADHGTCWINLGDSYAATTKGSGGHSPKQDSNRGSWFDDRAHSIPPGLKPKDLIGIPWRVALALQTDGWVLRSDIIWAKPNPMPESVTDRPTNAHEHVFLLTKQPRYWFDAEAVRERYTDPREGGEGFRWNSERYTNQTSAQSNHRVTGGRNVDRWCLCGHPESYHDADGCHAPIGIAFEYECACPGFVRSGGEPRPHPAGRNIRNVWEIATQPYAEAHFATYPQELVRRCLLAGCPEWVCRVCGKPRERIVDGTKYEPPVVAAGVRFVDESRGDKTRKLSGADYNKQVRRDTVGWSDCGHNNYRPGVVLDPFLGSGTTAYVARRHARHTIGIELSGEYCELIARRTQQLSLEVAGSVDAEGADARDSENPAPRSTTPQLPLEHDDYGTPATPLVRSGKNERSGDRRKEGFHARWKQ